MYVGHLTDEELMLHCRNLPELTPLEQELFHRMEVLMDENFLIRTAADELDNLLAKAQDALYTMRDGEDPCPLLRKAE